MHRHRVADQALRRVSELVYIKGQPAAILEWIDTGGVRSPLYLCPLDPEKLRKVPGVRNTWSYDGVTTDPRYPG
jgi:hypothetical protein